MEKITCLICNKLIPTGDLVYGNNGNFYCEKCFDKPPKLTRNQLFAEGKREFYSSRKAWNEKSKQNITNIMNKYSCGIPQAPELSQNQKVE